jgi:hypothetical protein
MDVIAALGAASVGAAVAGWMLSAMALPLPWVVLAVAVVFFGPTFLALLLKRSESLNLCFQIAVLTASAALLVIHAVLADPAGMWTKPLEQLLSSTAAAGIEGDRKELIALWSNAMWGALTAMMLASVLGALFLGRWWMSLLHAPGTFGEEYRRLRLGKTLGVAVTILFVSALAFESLLIASLACVAFTALAMQGLAAAHRSKAHGRLNRGWLAAIYVLLIVPLSTSIAVLILAIWGFADNWLRPRTQTI